MSLSTISSAVALCVAALSLTGCATPPAADSASTDQWHPVHLPGKEHTQYTVAHKDGRLSTAAVSEKSASMWRRRLHMPAEALGEVQFSWWVQDLIASASVAEASRADAPARVMFAFEGDIGRLPARTRALFELAEALTGERPPYATLVYVWDAKAPVGTVIVNPRTDRIRKIVVDSGPGQLRRWRDHQRDLNADFRLAFGEAPGPLKAVALMTDSDNTSSSAKAWYGPVNFVADTPGP
jgi:Protein of unknown function (DUF3047)